MNIEFFFKELNSKQLQINLRRNDVLMIKFLENDKK